MTRYNHRLRIAGLAGVVSAVAIAVAAAPAGATLVCPPGVTDKKYCTNVLPVAVTNSANAVKATSATLNGVSGPGVSGGDVTKFFFQFGTSSATYGQTTPTGTVGSCPPGVGQPTYCPGVPASENVSAGIGALTPCTTYHFRIVSTNPDGTTLGNDKVFATGFGKPIKHVTVHPKRVKRGHRFKVTITLSLGAKVKIFLRRHGKNVKSFDLGFHNAGKFSKKIKAPHKKGKYVVRVVARTNCGKQTVNKNLRVH